MAWQSQSEILLIFSLAFTIAHAAEEAWGPGAPLWDNLGALVGVRLPRLLGLALFCLLLPAVLITIACIGYTCANGLLLSLLMGARLGDVFFSHWMPVLAFPSIPNPGTVTAGLYTAEVCWLCLCFGIPSVAYALIGALTFAVVLPSLWLVGRVVPYWRLP